MSEAPPDIFLSYNREDQAAAQTLRGSIRGARLFGLVGCHPAFGRSL